MIFQQPTVVAQPGLGRRPPDRGGPRDPPRHEAARSAGAARSSCSGWSASPTRERRLKAFPHEMSGGMAQRVMIAMALACEPELLIADEPTTALDVTIQAQILDLMRNLRDETGTAIILITHDLGVVAEMCDRVAVMYAGEIVEQTDVTTLFRRPAPPVHAGPDRLDPGRRRRSRTSWRSSRATCPNLIDLPEGLPVRAALPDPDRGGRRARDRGPPGAPAGRDRPRRPLLALPRRGRQASCHDRTHGAASAAGTRRRARRGRRRLAAAGRRRAGAATGDRSSRSATSSSTSRSAAGSCSGRSPWSRRSTA